MTQEPMVYAAVTAFDNFLDAAVFSLLLLLLPSVAGVAKE